LTVIEEFRRNWLLLLVVLIGGSLLPIPIYALSLFIGSWAGEFGWARAETAIANSCFTIALVAASPLAGRVVDRFGSRIPAMTSLLLLAGGFALVSRVGPDLWTLYVAYALIGLGGAGTSAVAFTRPVCAFFHRARGLALGITVTGTALASLMTPIVVATTLGPLGWRGTWLVFAAMALCVFPLLMFGLKDAPAPTVARDAAANRPVGGMSFQVAFRTPSFWLMGLSFLLISTAILAALGHMMPILRDSGLSARTAILLQSGMGVGLILGRILCGYIVDRVFAPLVYQIICGMAAVGFLLLAGGWGVAASSIGIVLVGAAMGAEYDLVAYLVSRYFGLANYGRIYGWQFGFAMFGGVVGPFVIGFAYSSTGSYTAFLILACALAVVAGVLLRGLGPYPGEFEAVPADGASRS
jgi:MFS family permease